MPESTPEAEHQHRDNDRLAVGQLKPFEAGQPQAAVEGRLCFSRRDLAEVHQPGHESHQHGDRGQHDRDAVDGPPDFRGRLAGQRLAGGQERRRADQPQGQRQQEQAERHFGMQDGQVQIDHHQHPRRHEEPIFLARQRRSPSSLSAR